MAGRGTPPSNRWRQPGLKSSDSFPTTGRGPLQEILHTPLTRCLSQSEEYMFLKKYKANAVEHMPEYGHYLTKPYKPVTSGPQ
ncbi:UNVERIFIED_CONTAM: hypothetical protein Sradi_6913900 [Sesamum radiatum]|uniref:Uncharacterized protein n=1 Tax=Sesamum radiatum TaxID=300843 RepID=A0AAW2JHP6_SESRA